MKLVFFGTGVFGLPSLEALKNSSHELLSVVSSPDRPKGRHRMAQRSPIKEWAVKARLPVFQFTDINSAESAQGLEKLKPEVFVVISFGTLLSLKLLKVPRSVSLNVHSSLLPRYRGAAPIHWALIDGETQTGVSVMRMTEELDAGDIALQKQTPILPEDDIGTLERRLSFLGRDALLETLAQLEKGTLRFKPQGEARLKYARKLTKEDGHLDWNQKAQSIVNRIRAMKRWPTCYSYYEGKRIIFVESEPSEKSGLEKATAGQRPASLAAGNILAASEKEGLFIAAKDRPIRIKMLQQEGGRPMPAEEFLRGFHFKEGAFLE